MSHYVQTWKRKFRQSAAPKSNSLAAPIIIITVSISNTYTFIYYTEQLSVSPPYRHVRCLLLAPIRWWWHKNKSHDIPGIALCVTPPTWAAIWPCTTTNSALWLRDDAVAALVTPCSVSPVEVIMSMWSWGGLPCARQAVHVSSSPIGYRQGHCKSSPFRSPHCVECAVRRRLPAIRARKVLGHPLGGVSPQQLCRGYDATSSCWG